MTDLEHANLDFVHARVRLSMGFGSQADVAEKLAKLQQVIDEENQLGEQEQAIMRRFRERNQPKPQPFSVLSDMGADEYVEGRWIVDAENRTRRML